MTAQDYHNPAYRKAQTETLVKIVNRVLYHYTFCTMCGDTREADYRTEFDPSGKILIGIYTCRTCGYQERTYQTISLLPLVENG